MIKRLSGYNFLPFRDEFDVPLDGQGLILVRGDNRVSAAANDNGSGKTSLAHAIAWCLWGEDLLGRKADAVANRFTEGACSVRLDMEDALGPWAVIRGRRPAGLEVEGLTMPPDSDMSVIQAAIDARLGFGLRTFRNAVVFGQGAFDRFASADQAEQMKMLDEIQGIDFSEARKRTKAWRDKIAGQKSAIESEMREASDSLLHWRRSVVTMTGFRDSYAATKRATVGGLKARLLAAVDATARAEADVKALDESARLLVLLRAEDAKVEELRTAHRLALNDEEFKGQMQDEAGRDLRRFEEALEALFGKSMCPTCRAKVDDSPRIRERFAKDRAATTRAAERTAKDYRKALGITAAALAALEAEQEILSTMAGIMHTPFGATEDSSKVIGRLEWETTPLARKKLVEAIAQARAEAESLGANIKKAEGEKWDGTVKLDEAESNIVALTARIAREQGRLDRAGVALAIADYCTEAFSDRGLRSMLADSVADFLNERMATHLLALTAGEAKNVMSSQTALKKGGTRERISFTPSWAWGGEGTGTGSAGQDRRVDLATFASVQDLAESRSARPFPLKIYDEPFDALDSRGKEMACAWLREQAKAYGTVLLVTHSEELAAVADPDQTWTIVHDDTGARIEKKLLS